MAGKKLPSWFSYYFGLLFQMGPFSTNGVYSMGDVISEFKAGAKYGYIS